MPCVSGGLRTRSCFSALAFHLLDIGYKTHLCCPLELFVALLYFWYETFKSQCLTVSIPSSPSSSDGNPP